MANLVGARVVSVLYRMSPEHRYPAALDDAVAVYRELLKTYKPGHIAVYGSSAGAILTAQLGVRVRQLGLPEPAGWEFFGDRGLQPERGFTGDLRAARSGGGCADTERKAADFRIFRGP